MAAPVEVCPDCDLLQRMPAPRRRGAVRCARCGCALHAHRAISLQQDAALAVTTLILLTIANTFPLLFMSINGTSREATVLDGIAALWDQHRFDLSVLVAAVAVVIPATHALAVLVRSALIGRARRAARAWTSFSLGIAPWGMTEVYLLGALVAFVRLRDLATVLVGPALYAFALMSLVTAYSSAYGHVADLWSRWED